MKYLFIIFSLFLLSSCSKEASTIKMEFGLGQTITLNDMREIGLSQETLNLYKKYTVPDSTNIILNKAASGDDMFFVGIVYMANFDDLISDFENTKKFTLTSSKDTTIQLERINQRIGKSDDYYYHTSIIDDNQVIYVLNYLSKDLKKIENSFNNSSIIKSIEKYKAK